MNSFAVLALASVLACASAGVLVPGVQYHGQDLVGGYAFGYATPNIETKTEVRPLDGTVLSGYKYLDGYGQVQHVEYKGEPKIGFQVTATNLPLTPVQDTPEVALAKKEHLKAVEIAKMQQQMIIPQVGYTGYVQPVIATKSSIDMIPTKDTFAIMEELKKKEDTIKDTMEVAKAKEEHLKAVEKEIQLQKQQEKLIMMKSSEKLIKPELMSIKSDIYTPTLSLIKPDIYSVKSDYTLLKNEPILPFVQTDSFVPYVKTEPYVPVIKTNPIVPLVKSDLISHQYHSQDEMGGFAYSYDDLNSAKVEAGLAGKDVTGGYSYVDANSKLQTVRYIADDKGFRVAATNLPIHDYISGGSLIKDAKYQLHYY